MKASLTTGNYDNEDITITSIGADSKAVTCSGSITGQPFTYVVSPLSKNLTGFNYGTGTGPSRAQSFVISAENVTDSVTIASQSGGFEVSFSPDGPFVVEIGRAHV